MFSYLYHPELRQKYKEVEVVVEVVVEVEVVVWMIATTVN